ncbi:MAG: hypothetical protein ACJ77E_02820 [Gaiellaceae bacterium]
MKRRAAIARACTAGAIAIAAAGIAGASGSRATTAPGVVSVSKLVITDHAVMIRIRRNTWASVVRYPRGAEVRYDVSNRGRRAYSLDILGSVTGRLAPGRQTTMLVSWTHRGKFVFRALPNGARIVVWVT